MDLFATGALALALAATGAPAQKPDALKVDTRPDYTFQKPIANGMGATSLASLKGKPVVIEFWSMKDDSSVRVAVPAALALSRKHGDSLHVLLVDADGGDIKAVERMALEKKWLGSDAMWTNEPPIAIDPKSLPRFALLNAQGKVVLQGDATTVGKKLDDAVAREIALAAQAPKELPDSLKMAWKSYHDGELAKGIAGADQVAAKGGSDARSASDLADVMRKRTADKIGRAKWMMEHGYVLEAKQVVAELSTGLTGEKTLGADVNQLKATLDSDAMKREVAAAQQFVLTQAKLHEKGLDATDAGRNLSRIIQDYGGTKTAKRAKHWLDVLGG